MARKVYTISNINGGIGNDKNFPKPWTVVDCENIDISADSNSIKIAGNTEKLLLNVSWWTGSIVWVHLEDTFFTRKWVFLDEKHYPAILRNKWVDDLPTYCLTSLPDIVPERKEGPDVWGNGWNNQSDSAENAVLGSIWYGNFLFLATQNFLHILKGNMQWNSEISRIPWDGEYSSPSGWERLEDLWYEHYEWTGPLKRSFSTITKSFQYQRAFNGVHSGSISIEIKYKASRYSWDRDSNEWKDYKKSYTIKKTFNARDSNIHDIQKICCLWDDIENVQVIFTPSSDFIGALHYNAIFETPRLTRSFELVDDGISYNVAKIAPSSSHPMFILHDMLLVGCGDIVKTFNINKSESHPNSWINIIPGEDILLGLWAEIVGITQYGSGIVIYVNKGNNAYQMFSTGVGGTIEQSIKRKDSRFLSVSNDGYQDFVVVEIGKKHHLYIVSWGNKKNLYTSGEQRGKSNIEAHREYLFNFWGISFSREDRALISSKEKMVYLYENQQDEKKLTKFSIGEQNLLTFAELWGSEISLFTYNYKTKSNMLSKIKLWWDRIMEEASEWYIILPPLITNQNEGTLGEIWFGAYLPNNKSKIEVWAKVNEKDYITIRVKSQKNKVFEDLKINNSVKIELLDNGLNAQWEGYLSFRIFGDIEKVKDYNGSVAITQNWISFIKSKDIVGYDNFIKIEEITKENQKLGNKEIGANHSIKVQKINQKIGDFGKLYLKLLLKAEKGQNESPKIYAPIYLTYYTKDV